MSTSLGALKAVAPAPARELVAAPGYPAPFQGLDEVLELGYAEARYAKTLDAEAEIFAGHYPHFPIFPGVLVYEAFAQAIRHFADHHGLGLAGVARIKSLRFLKSLYPGDAYRIEIKRGKEDPDGNLEFQLQCLHGDVLAASASLVAGRTLSAAPADVAIHATAVEHDARHPASVLPQRYPMLLVDRMLALEPGESVSALKNVTLAEPCYRRCVQMDDPAALAYPDSLVIESFAQTVGLLLDSIWDMSGASGNVVVFGGFQDVAMHGSAYPGDAIVHQVRLEHGNATSAMFSGCSSVNGKVILSYKKLIAMLLPKQQLRGDA